MNTGIIRFRSTGSYEPDPYKVVIEYGNRCFDPQALTSLTERGTDDSSAALRFDPQALTSLTLICIRNVI